MGSQVDRVLFPGDAILAYIALAGATCTIYDHLTTLDVEIEIVWSRPKWQIPQGLFFVNRYIGLVAQIYIASFYIKNLLGESSQVRITSDMLSRSLLTSRSLSFIIGPFWRMIRDTGNTFNLVAGFLTAVTFFAMHGIMIYRVSSMYTHDRKVLRVLVTAYVAEFLSLTIIQLVQMVYGASVHSDQVVSNPVDFCAKEKFMPWIFVVWIPLAIFELLIFGLALALGIRYYRIVGSDRMFSDYRNENRKTSLLYILLRDSIIFPFIYSLVCILNLITFYLTAFKLRHATAHTVSLFPNVLAVIFGSRLILNLREAYYEPYDQEFSIRVDTTTISESDRDSIPLQSIQIPHPNLAAPASVHHR